MAGKGGSRAGAGRKPKPAKPAAVSRTAADEILDFLALEKNPHRDSCRCLKCRRRVLSTALDLRLRYHVEKSLLDRVLGLPSQAIEHKGGMKLELDGQIELRLMNGRKRMAGE